MILSIYECKSQLRRTIFEKGLMVIILKTFTVVLKLKQWTTNEFNKNNCNTHLLIIITHISNTKLCINLLYTYQTVNLKRNPCNCWIINILNTKREEIHNIIIYTMIQGSLINIFEGPHLDSGNCSRTIKIAGVGKNRKKYV